MKRRILSLCLALIMLFGSVPMEAFANTGNPENYMEGQLPPQEGQPVIPPEDPQPEQPPVPDPVVEEPVEEAPVLEEPVIEESPVVEEPAPSCGCETHCTETAVNAACPVCAVNFTQCAITAPVIEEPIEDPVVEKPTPSCDCAAHCTGDAVDAECPVCAEDFTQCAIEEVVEEEPTCGCEAHCTEDAANAECPVCAEDFTQCAIEESVEEDPEPTCDCEAHCTVDAVNADCPVCAEDSSACIIAEPGMTAEEVAELFLKLPEASVFDYYVSQEEWEQIEEDLYAALEAYDTLCETNFEEALRFNELYADLYLNASDIESYLLDNPGGSPYATNGGFDVAYDSNRNKFTVTLAADMDDVAPRVIRFNNGDPITYEVVKTGDRKYSFADDTNSGNYIITGSAAGYADQQIAVSAQNKSATLQVKTHTGSGNVMLFYLYSNNVPQPYNGASTDNSYYGPSGTGKPMVTLEVDLAALSRMPGVVYNGSSSWYFIPQYNADGSISINNVRVFWNAVLACTTETSRKALRDTGLYDIFKGYILKTEWDGPHSDGIFDVPELPIYVAELYENNNYFGSVTGTNSNMKSLDDVLALCDQNLGGTVYWQTKSPQGESVGYYYGNNNKVIKVTVKPFDNSGAQTVTGSDIRYTPISSQHYLAKYRMTTQDVTGENTYSVTYTDGDANGTAFASVSYPVVFTRNATPKIPAYNGIPTRDGYTFIGWQCKTDSSVNINGETMPNMPRKDLVFDAQWEVTKYTVIWVNYDNTELGREQMAYGSTPSYKGNVPTRPEDDQYSYAFTGWTPAIDIVTKDVTYKALYEPFLNTYTVTWCDDQGKVLETDRNVPYGATPSFDGTVPTKEDTAQYTYTFEGWDPEVETVTGDITYTAQFQAAERSYTVRWLDDDGTVLETDYNVLYGTDPSYNGQEPAKAATAEHTYTFAGWSPALKTVTGDMDYVATYNQTTNTYTVKWISEGVTVETDTEVPYGTMPTYDGETPEKTDPTGEYTYVFAKWTPAVSEVTGDQTYTAEFTSYISKYNVTWKYGLNLAKQELDADQTYGTLLSFSDGDNLNYESGNYNYIFSGWQIAGQEKVYTQAEVDAMTVTGHITLTAQYWAELKGHTVNVQVLLDASSQSDGTITGGTPVSIETVMGENTTLYLYGIGGMRPTALAPNAAVGSYSAFLVPNGQYKIYSSHSDQEPLSSYEILVADADVQRNLYFYSVTYDLGGGTINGSDDSIVTYHRGAVNVMDAIPQKEGSTFLGWQLEDSDTLYAPGGKLTDSIRQAYTLTALWGNARVNLVVKLNHEHSVDGVFKGRDQRTSNTMTTDITYRANAQDDYVEMVGIPEKTQSIRYSGKDTTELTFNNYYTGLDNRYMYGANVFVDGYEVVDRSISVDATGEVYTVTVEMQYRPHMFNLEYSTEMAAGTAQTLVPTATDVKIISYRGEGTWLPISAHTANSTDVFFNETAQGETFARFGSGSYAVPVYLAEGQPYYYRVAAVGFTLADGTELYNNPAENSDGWSFTSRAATGYPEGAYTAQLIFSGKDNAVGVFGMEGQSGQQGSLKLLVTAHPDSIVLHYNDNVTANRQIDNVFAIPSLDAYAPGERIGYTFAGWYLDEGLTQKATVGTLLDISDNAPTHLYAKWNGDITVSGTVYVSKLYSADGTDHEILSDDRLSSVIVRVMNDQNLPIKSVTVQVSYTGSDDYGQVDYQITGIPDNGTQYSLQVMQAAGNNYATVYQNEPDSLTEALSFGKYGTGKNAVLTGEVDERIATVNAYLHFTPETYGVKYAIDATAIGEAFRPSRTRTLILADDSSREVPSWYVITQMVDDDGNLNGQANTLSGGRASGSYPVWKAHANGALYNFSARLQDMTYKPTGKGESQTVTIYNADTSNLPFVMSYNPQLTYYDATASEQQTLQIILTPRKYAVSYVANGGTMPESYPEEHTWSFETPLAAQPTREGYTFKGWYTDASLKDKFAVTAIGAEVAQNVTLYAKWETDSYRIDYTLNGGTAEGNPTSYTVQTPTFVLNAPTREGYTFLGWTGSNGTTYEKLVTIPKGTTGNLAYTAHWEKSQYVITVTVENGTADTASSVTVTHGDTKTIAFTANSGYALDTVTVDDAAAELTNGAYTFANISGNHSIHVIFAADDNGDDTPDKYQATVTYVVVNGTLAPTVQKDHVFDLKTYVDGEWVDAAPKLGDTLPTVDDGDLIPAEGYNGTGYWWEKITEETPVTADASYTWEFTGKILHTVTYPDATRTPNNSGIYPDSITNNILYGSRIRVDPNGGAWTTDIFGSTQTHRVPYEFPLKSNIHLGTPVRENYVFRGWLHTNGEAGVAHVYTAQWAPKVYNIRYVMPNSFLDVPNPAQYTVETDDFTLHNPHRPGYEFDGWSGTGIEGMSTQVTVTKGSTGDRVYTANWTARTDTPYQIRYYFETLEGGSYEEREALRKNPTGTTDSTVNIPTPYDTFDGFTLNADKSMVEGTLNGSGDLILYLIYDRDAYTVRWKNGNLLLEEDMNVPYGADHSYDGTTPVKAPDAKYTYTFTHWLQVESSEENVIIYQAQFDKVLNLYTVEWRNDDGQQLHKVQAGMDEELQYTTIPQKPSSAKYHYVFTHWSKLEDETAVPVTDFTVKGNAVYIANYRAEDRLYDAAVRFFVDGSPATADAMADSLAGGKTLVLKSDAGTYNLTAKQGSPNVFTAEVPVGNYKVYLRYSGIDTVLDQGYLSIINQAAQLDLHYYSVSYHAGYEGVSTRVEYYPLGSEVKVGMEYTREGYNFLGWLHSSGTLYQEDDVLTESIAQKQDLTALWGNASLNLVVKLNHEHYVNGVLKGRDQRTSNTMVTDITYRSNAQDDYVEMVGIPEKSEPIVYSGNAATELTFEGYYTGLDNRYMYGANVFVNGYEVVDRSISVDAAGKVYTVIVEMQYRPHMFELVYTTEMAAGTAQALVPTATDVKIISYRGEGSWLPISAHTANSTDVFFNETAPGEAYARFGSGSYALPIHLTENQPYYYRVAAVGFTLADGTELYNNSVEDENGWSFSSKETAGYPEGAYTAQLIFGAVDNAVGVFAKEEDSPQQGTLKLLVTAHPAQVKLHRNDGTTDLHDTLEHVFAIPDLSKQVPERTGYTFRGWYTDADCTTPAASGTRLDADQTLNLYAGWGKNFSIQGDITALTSIGSDNTLDEHDQLTSVTLTLHRDSSDGQQVGLPKTIHLTQGEEQNTGIYEFEDVANDGSTYYVVVSAKGYSAAFRNEEVSAFTGTEGKAVDRDGNDVAVVDVRLTLDPTNFDLLWQIDATQLGTAFQPRNVKTYVMYDTNHEVGYTWKVISQMRTGDTDDVTKAVAEQFAAGLSVNSKYPVWQHSAQGVAYNYAIRIACMDVDLNGNGIVEESEKLAVPSNVNYRDAYENLPFRVYYEYPAYYVISTNRQNMPLTATLIPNTYTVTLNPNGGTLTMGNSGSNPITHTWSKDTAASFTLTRDGYVFEGWLDQDGNAVDWANESSLTVPAAMQENLVLTAQWTKITELIFDAEDMFEIYDGTKQVGGNELITSNLPEGYRFEGLTYAVEGTNVGDYTGAFTKGDLKILREKKDQRRITPEYEDVTKYFNVANPTLNPGILRISPKLVTVTAVDKEKRYDTEPFTEFTCTSEGIVAGDELGMTVTYQGDAVTAVNAGSYSIVPNVTITNSNYYVSAVNGTLKIKPSPVTVSIETEDKPYDQSNDARAKTNVTLNGALGSDNLSVQIESITFAGSDVARNAAGEVMEQTVTASGVTLGGNEKGNYYLDLDASKLTDPAKITPVPLELILHPVSREYNGSAEVAITPGDVTPLPGDHIVISYYPTTGTMEDAAVGDNKIVTVEESVLSAVTLAGEDAGNYNLTVRVSTVDIVKRKVSLRSDSAEKTYDGTALTAPGVTVVEGSFVNGEITNLHAAASLLGTIDQNEKIDNQPIMFDWVGSGNISNYDISYAYGTLSVLADENQNKIPDDQENRFTVKYMASGAHTNLEENVIHEELLTGMLIPAAPDVVADTGYCLDGWKLIEGTEGAGNTIGNTNLVYELLVKPQVYTITYVLEEDAVNAPGNPAEYTYGEGVDGFAPAKRDEYVFIGWYADASFTTKVTGISESEHGNKTLYPKWMEDNNVEGGDGTPDDYQVTVTYKVVNGTWADGKTDPIPVLFNLRQLDDDGSWVEVAQKLGSTIPSGMLPDEAHQDFGKWNRNINANTPVTDNATYIYTFGTRRTYDVTITVIGGTAKFGDDAYTEPVTVQHGDEPVLTFTPNTGYILDYARIKTASNAFRDFDRDMDNGQYTLDPVTEDVEIKVAFSPDQWNADEDDTDKPDDIPDSRQVVFLFSTGDANGTVSGKTTQVITLTSSKSVTPEAVTVQANTGYKLKNWTNEANEVVANPFAAKTVEGGEVYRFVAHFEEAYGDVTYRDAEDVENFVPQPNEVPVQVGKRILVDPNGGIWRQSTEVQILTITEAGVDLGIPVREGHVFMGWLCEPVVTTQGDNPIVYKFTAQWEADAQGDGIPDKYQKKVTFRIVNGVWSVGLFETPNAYTNTSNDIVVYLLLTDSSGNPSETGSAVLTPHIPTKMKANWGYHLGRWDVQPPATVSGNSSVTFTYSYQRIPTVTPQTGDDSNNGLWISLMAISVAGILALLYPVIRDKKKKNK